MRIAYLIIILMMMPSLADAQGTGQPWSKSATVKPVIVTKDFCEICNCCQQSPEFLKNIPMAPVSPEENIMIISRNAADVLKALSKENFGSKAKAMQMIVQGQKLKGVIDFCNACACCTEESSMLHVKPPKDMQSSVLGKYYLLPR